MARVRKVDTKPELIVRRALHAMGYRFRLHRRDLPGTPDIVLPARRKVIFVHGCFWHQHGCKLAGRLPQTREDYWGPKLKRNRERDQLAQRALTAARWEALTIWECETKDQLRLQELLHQYVEGPGGQATTE
jgi:DNA mismatch endonuclease (patch repair protein)